MAAVPAERDLLNACAGLLGLIEAAEETLAAPGDPDGITRAELAQAKGVMCRELAEAEQALVDLYEYPNRPQWVGDVHVPGRGGEQPMSHADPHFMTHPITGKPWCICSCTDCTGHVEGFEGYDCLCTGCTCGDLPLTGNDEGNPGS